MVDYAARAAIRSAVEDYLSDRITAFVFDERLSAIKSDDQTVREVLVTLWFFYDDVKDHHVIARKEDWDYIQRLLLLLDSGGEISKTGRRNWHLSQAVAVATLAVVAASYHLHPEIWLPPVLLGGVVSMCLSRWRERFVESVGEVDVWKCHPFATLRVLRQAIDRAPSFRKSRYRSEIESRCIRSRISHRIGMLPSMLMWLYISPIVLLFQSFPCRTSKTNVSWD